MVFGLFYSSKVFAIPTPNQYPSTLEGQLQYCKDLRQDRANAGFAPTSDCYIVPYSPTVAFWRFDNSNGSYSSNPFTYKAPDDSACTGAPGGFDTAWDGKILSGFSICPRVPNPTIPGSTIQCAVALSPVGAPFVNPYSGKWQTKVSVTNSVSLCSADKQSDKVYAGDGTAAKDVPPVTEAPKPTGDMPKICGGGSCYDPNADKYCASVSGGGQVCVSGSQARTPGGACTDLSGVSVCSGSPNAPKPANPPIDDPATQIKATDKVTQADPHTGTPQTVTTNVYNVTPGASNSGKQEGDVGPADDGQDGKSAGGGETCDAPPVCRGDAPTCLVADQVWRSRCEGKDEQPEWTKVGQSDLDQYSTSDVPLSDVFKPGGTGMEAIQSTAWAGTQCPALEPVVVFGEPWTFDQDLFCQWLAVLRAVTILAATFVAAKILAAGSAS